MAATAPVRLSERALARHWRAPQFFLAILALLGALIIVTRVPLAPQYLFSFDSVNLALSLEHFDPRLHQPQPPGYPLFVAQARLLNRFLGSPERTFLVCKVIGGILGPVLLFLLGTRMYSRWAGTAAALLLALNPVFWRTTLASALRTHSTVLSVLTAYLCWRALEEQDSERRAHFAVYASLALGVCGGWRPGLMVLLIPLWLVCAWRALGSVRRMALASLVLALGAATWIAPLVAAAGGPLVMAQHFAGYLTENAQDSSLLYGSAFWGWWKMTTQAFVWHALAVVGWFWAPLLVIACRCRRASGIVVVNTFPTPKSLSRRAFFLLWVGPKAAFFLLIHVASPGHTASVVPALCLLGSAFLERAAMRVAAVFPGGRAPRAAFLTVAWAINVWFFSHPFRIPHERPHVRGTLAQVREQFRFWGAFALHDTSYPAIQRRIQATNDRVRVLRSMGPDRDLVLVWQDDDVSWRKITYYFASTPTWVLEGLSGPASQRPAPRLWRHNRIVDAPHGSAGQPLLLPAHGRVAWLLHLHSAFPAELAAQGVPLARFGNVFLTDLAQAPAEFRAGPFLFRKQLPSASN